MSLADAKDDKRPKRGLWAPGEYYHAHCNKCGESFVGDKRAYICADCAYAPRSAQAEFEDYVRQQALRDPALTPEARAVFSLLAIPSDVQGAMTEAQREAVIKSVADAIRAAERDAVTRFRSSN